MTEMDDKIRVMIVDDEYIVREDLRTLVDWEAQGFQVVCEANNGEQGIAFARKYNPELIIADIKMPVKDGLQMAKAILERGAGTEFILLTAYDEFDFARKAMKMGISHYLLKHEIEAPVLLGLLRETREKILAGRRRQWERLGVLLRELLVGSSVPGEGALDLAGGFGAFLLVRMPVGAQVLQNLIGTLDSGRYMRLLHVMESGDTAVFFLVYSRVSELLYLSETADFARRVSDCLGTAVALSARVQQRGQLRAVYEQACQSLELSVFAKGRKCVITPELPVDPEVSHGSVSAAVYLLKECLRQKNYREFMGVLSSYVKEQCAEKNRGAQFLYAKPFFAGLLEEHNESRCLLDKRCFDGLLSAGDDAGRFVEKVGAVVEKMAEQEGATLSRNMRRVIRFIEEHYAENLALEDIAGILGMNAMYAGQLFKKEVGASFKQYLCSFRIERAKALLLAGQYKIYEVGELVGYQSTQYFSSIFKKETGQSPGEFLAEKSVEGPGEEE